MPSWRPMFTSIASAAVGAIATTSATSAATTSRPVERLIAVSPPSLLVDWPGHCRPDDAQADAQRLGLHDVVRQHVRDVHVGTEFAHERLLHVLDRGQCYAG